MTQDAVITRREGAIGRITLNRPKALNALTEDMCAAMLAQLKNWAVDPAVHAVVIDSVPGKAFCAGGDVRAIYDAGMRRDPHVMSFFRTEYRMNAAIRRLPKPYIALIDGFAFGGGCGVSIHGSYRVASENAVFSMPETAIGLFPDIGATYFLNQLPGEIGMYLALTSTRIGAADALYCGLATNFVPSRDHAAVLSRLAQGEKADVVLAGFGGKPSGVSALRKHRDAIDRAFSASTVEDVLDRLALEGDWGNETASILRSRSPTSLKVTFRQMREGAALDFESCQLMEFRIMARMMDGQDFYEGVRAALIDKDQSPRWQPSLLHMVSEAEIERYFAPLDDGEFTL
jgi:enoyl-CoA hydratase/carnithine racemase